MRILTVIGARPQFVKAAALSRELSSRKGIEEIIVHTGQHFDRNMSEVFFEEMEIPRPRYNLEINSLSHGAMTGRMLEGIEKLILDEKPDMVLVYGDTNSTIAGALAARKLHVSVGHVEAGLRSFSMQMPEEVNRILTDRISDHLFCPTLAAVKNLQTEGSERFGSRIYHTGDVMQDAANYYSEMAGFRSGILGELGYPEGFVLATIHREENTDNLSRLRSIIEALNEISRDQKVICPLHPRTKKLLKGIDVKPQFTIIDPVGYFDMITLIKASSMVMTDSGGLQKEAFFFHRPCVTLREQTEWIELVEGGFNKLAGADREVILSAYRFMQMQRPDFSADLYGRGYAARNITDILESL